MAFTKITNAGFGLTTGTLVGVAASFSSTVSVGGTLTYEDVTNVDSVGLITARNGIEVTDKGVQVGTGATVDSAAANTLTFLTGGSERVRVTSDGKVGVNTDMGGAPASLYPFSVYRSTGTGYVYTETAQSGASAGLRAKAGTADFTIFTTQGTGQLAVYDNTNSAERLRIDSSGRLLVGATSTTGVAKLFVKGNTSSDTGVADIATNLSAGGSITSGTEVGNLRFTDASANRFAFILCSADADTGTNDYPGRLAFWTTSDGASSPTERMRIDSSGRLLVGTTTEGHPNLDDLTIATTGHTGITIRSGTVHDGQIGFSDGTSGDAEYRGQVLYSHNTNSMRFVTDATERLRIDNSGNIGINNTAPADKLHVGGNIRFGTNTTYYGVIEHEAGVTGANIYTSKDTGGHIFKTGTTPAEVLRIDNSGRVGIKTTSPDAQYFNDLVIGDGSGDHGITLRTSATGSSAIAFSDATSGSGRYAGYLQYDHSNNSMKFYLDGGNLRWTIENDGDFTNKQSNVGSVTGEGITIGRQADPFVIVTRDADCPLFLNRTSSDGNLVIFYQDNSVEGSIQVSGSTVSYNGGHLSRWSQLVGISTNIKSDRPTILRGSVLSNLDEMCEWGEEDNEQLNRMKVSDVEGDINVSGVFQAWDDDDDTYTNDFYCAMTGDFVIRIASGVTVQRGNLLMSAGDGTAKPQGDGYIQDKTIAKVTSTTVSATYSDGSYCVPCVLMAC